MPTSVYKKLSLAVAVLVALLWHILAVISYGLAIVLVHTPLFPSIPNRGLTFMYAWIIVLSYIVYLFILPQFLGYSKNLRAFWREIGFSKFEPRSVFILISFLAFTTLFSIVFREWPHLFASPSTPWMITIEAPLIEELIFRGITMALFLQHYSKWSSALLSSLLFGLWHIDWWNILIIVQAFIGALLVFSVLRLQTKNIWTGVCAHFLMLHGLARSALFGFVLVELLLLLYVLVRKITSKKGPLHFW